MVVILFQTDDLHVRMVDSPAGKTPVVAVKEDGLKIACSVS